MLGTNDAVRRSSIYSRRNEICENAPAEFIYLYKGCRRRNLPPKEELEARHGSVFGEGESNVTSASFDQGSAPQ